MRVLSLLLAALLSACGAGEGTASGPDAASSSTASLYDLTVNLREAPMGVSGDEIFFSWKMADDERIGQCQTAYRLRVAADAGALDRGDVLWDSGRTESDQSLWIPYDGPALAAETPYIWEVEAWEADGVRVAGTARSTFETAPAEDFFDAAGAAWIAAPAEELPDLRAGEHFRIALTLRLEDTSAGVVWGYSAEDHGMLRQRIVLDDGEDTVRLLTDKLVRDRDDVWSADSGALGTVRAGELQGRTFSWEIEVDGTTAVTSIDGVRVWEQTLPEARGSEGAFGLHHDRGDRAWIDSFAVTAADGTTLLRDTFDDPWDTVFGEQAVYVTTDGMLCADGALLLTPAGSSADAAAPLFRRTFVMEEGRGIRRARLYATAAGIYRFRMNGAAVSDTWFDPGNTAYNLRTDYQIYDVTALLAPGDNVLAADLGHGWYDRAVGYTGTGAIWGERNALRAVLRITYEDGTEQTVVTDDTWRVCADGPVRGNDFWQGEVYDARKERTGFDAADYAEGDAWSAAEVCVPAHFEGVLSAQEKEPVRVQEVLAGTLIGTQPDGTMVYDFGEELTGVCRIRVRGGAGGAVLLRHGEWLNEAAMKNRDGAPGTVYTRNLLGAQSVDRYVLRGDADGEEYTPAMTFHGFRYVEVHCSSADITVEGIEALALSSDLPEAGHFTCSDERVNRLLENIGRSRRGNALSIPTDCPQRSERFGWTGDAQVFSATALDLADGYAWYEDYVRSLIETQDPATGSVGDIAPRNFGTDAAGRGGNGGNNVWGDAIVILPWELYCRYGSTVILSEAYGAVSEWIDYLVRTSDDYVRPESGYGDFLALDDPAVACINTAWSAHVCDLAARMAAVLGREEDAARFAAHFEGFRQAFLDNWVTEVGWTTVGSEGSFALGLAFDLFPEEMRETAADNLETTIGAQGGATMTGFATTPRLYEVLCACGKGALAWRMLLREDAGSLLDQAAHGATTVWENRNAYRGEDDGTYTLFGSLNHPAFGSVGHWLFARAAGIRYDEVSPGFRHFILEPTPDEALSWASASYSSVCGPIESGWEYTAEGLTFHAAIPANTSATLILPAGAWRVTAEKDGGVYAADFAEGERGTVVTKLPAGRFVIRAEADG